MRNTLLMIGALIGAGMLAAPANAVNYDCSKPGNANKTACKGKIPAAPAAATPAPPKTVTRTATKATPHYDCSKPGNANKAVCKGGAVATAPAPVAAPAPRTVTAARPAPARAAPAVATRAPAPSNGRTVAWTTKTGKVLHYDCSKAGNQNKQACK